MTFVKKGIVIAPGVAGEADDEYVYYPSVIENNGKIYLYYSAYDGSNDRIALSISDDGFNFVKKGVVVPLGEAGEVDDESVYLSSAIKIDDKIYLYYSAYDGLTDKIALAISDDGFNFVKKGVVVPLGEAGEVDDGYIYLPSAIKIDDKIYLYYSAYDGSHVRIALAISEDGFNFVKKGVVVPLGEAGEVDDATAYYPSVIENNGKIYLYYSAYDGSNDRIALAISEDGFNFVKKGVVVPLGEAGEVDDEYIYSPSAIKINDKIYLYYSADDGLTDKIALAISEDGF